MGRPVNVYGLLADRADPVISILLQFDALNAMRALNWCVGQNGRIPKVGREVGFPGKALRHNENRFAW